MPVSHSRIIGEGLAFDDILLVPAWSEVVPSDVSLETHISATVRLNIPLLSAAMDTVSEARMAIALAVLGGMAVIHRNMDVARQAQEVRQVKRYASGIVRDPVTIEQNADINKCLALQKEHGISGLPVLADGLLVGIVTNRDVRYETSLGNRIASVMTPREKLVTVREDATPQQVKKLLHDHRLEKILVVNEAFQLRGLITVKDLEQARLHPNASKDPQGRLQVGAAVGTGGNTTERVAALVQEGIDMLVLDTAHGHSRAVVEQARAIKKAHPTVPLMAGNVVTGAGARALLEAGVDAIKVGIGAGSICTTRIVTGVGVPQVSALLDVVREVDGALPVVADGGVHFSGDLAKALAVGASAAMVGNLLAGTEEAPGEEELFQGRRYKNYRGMGSLGAMGSGEGARDRYYQGGVESGKLVPEGVEGRVPYKGSVASIVAQLMGGLRAGMGYTGCRDLATFRSAPRLVRISPAGMRESHVQNVNITREAPNYPMQ